MLIKGAPVTFLLHLSTPGRAVIEQSRRPGQGKKSKLPQFFSVELLCCSEENLKLSITLFFPGEGEGHGTSLNKKFMCKSERVRGREIGGGQGFLR